MRDERFKTISVLDPAFDTAALTFMTLTRFVETRDYALVDGKWLPGRPPTIFHLREVPHGLWEYVATADSERGRYLRAFMTGVVKAEHLVGSDGVALTGWEPTSQQGKQWMMTEEESYRFAPNEREEIGSVVYAHSFLARKIALFCRLPSSVREHLEQRHVLRAEPSPSTALLPSNEQPSESTGPIPIATATG